MEQKVCEVERGEEKWQLWHPWTSPLTCSQILGQRRRWCLGLGKMDARSSFQDVKVEERSALPYTFFLEASCTMIDVRVRKCFRRSKNTNRQRQPEQQRFSSCSASGSKRRICHIFLLKKASTSRQQRPLDQSLPALLLHLLRTGKLRQPRCMLSSTEFCHCLS